MIGYRKRTRYSESSSGSGQRRGGRGSGSSSGRGGQDVNQNIVSFFNLYLFLKFLNVFDDSR